MTSIREGNIVWTFPEGWYAEKYDDWEFYRNQFQKCADGNKAMDILALNSNEGEFWMIEAKDYRRNRRNPSKGPLPIEVAKKTRDTLAGVFAASTRAVSNEKSFAHRATNAKKIRVVLHLEQAKTPTKLFPLVVDPADAKQKLKKLLKAIDPRVTVMSTSANRCPWTTQWAPQ
mgnify:FL=1